MNFEILRLIYRPILKLPENLQNTISYLCCVLYGQKRESYKILQSLKDKHKGERCFVVCTGPSLRVEDLDTIKLHGDVTFACNKIDMIFPKTTWRPDYYTVFDDNVLNTLYNHNRLNQIDAKYRFFSDYNFLKTRRGKNNVYLTRDGNRKYLEHPEFAKDLSEKIITIATVTYSILEIAVYMGFKEIYIIGCDNSYSLIRQKDGTIVSTGKDSYFSGSTDMQTQAVDVWEMDVAYKCAKDYAEKNNIKIQNATRGGHLEIFERVDFDSLFK